MNYEHRTVGAGKGYLLSHWKITTCECSGSGSVNWYAFKRCDESKIRLITISVTHKIIILIRSISRLASSHYFYFRFRFVFVFQSAEFPFPRSSYTFTIWGLLPLFHNTHSPFTFVWLPPISKGLYYHYAYHYLMRAQKMNRSWVTYATPWNGTDWYGHKTRIVNTNSAKVKCTVFGDSESDYCCLVIRFEPEINTTNTIRILVQNARNLATATMHWSQCNSLVRFTIREKSYLQRMSKNYASLVERTSTWQVAFINITIVSK